MILIKRKTMQFASFFFINYNFLNGVAVYFQCNSKAKQFLSPFVMLNVVAD